MVEGKFKKDIILAPLTTFKIGGPAKFFIEIKTKEELVEAYEWAEKEKQKVFIFGGGSNVLVNDKGVEGLIIKINNNEIVARGERLDSGAGASLAQAVSLALNNNLTGIEWATGIPGATIGGAVVGNAGAFSASMAEAVETVEVFNIKKKRFKIFSNKDCKFNYRESVFKHDDNYLVWNIVLKLRKEKKRIINKLIGEYVRFRGQGQPKLPSAGSVFKNLSIADLREFNENLANMAEQEKKVKNGMIGAGWLIELAGLKGKTINGAKVSLEHANFIVNTGKATSSDVAMLISYIKQQVRNKFKVQLAEEVQYLGF